MCSTGEVRMVRGRHLLPNMMGFLSQPGRPFLGLQLQLSLLGGGRVERPVSAPPQAGNNRCAESGAAPAPLC